MLPTLFSPLDDLPPLKRLAALGDRYGTLAAALPALAGLAWLAAETPLPLSAAQLLALAAVLALVALFARLNFYIIAESGAGGYIDYSSALDDLVLWTFVLLLGPLALWAGAAWLTIDLVRRWPPGASPLEYWNRLRNYTFNLAIQNLGSLVALVLYRAWGGQIPLAGLSWAATAPALAATLVRVGLQALVWIGYLETLRRLSAPLRQDAPPPAYYRRFLLLALLPTGAAEPFAVLAAGIYIQMGLGAFLFFLAGLALVSLLAHRLSQAVEQSRQQSRQLEKLEQLSRAILAAPPTAAGLPQILAEHVPQMFAYARIEIRLLEGRGLLQYPPDEAPLPAGPWAWLQEHPQEGLVLAGRLQPWDGLPAACPLAWQPILDAGDGRALGGIFLSWPPRRVMAPPQVDANTLAAAAALARQAALALHRADEYRKDLESQRLQQELALAGQLQASLLPGGCPVLPGWSVAAALEAAREASGDFFDLIPLPGGRLGLVVADVADKGMGAALFMAITRTLIRTYALEFPGRPAQALALTSQRLLSDSPAGQFVTVFYGELDLAAGELVYCNAGHNPPLLLAAGQAAPQPLPRTGMALGVLEEATWQEARLVLGAGDLLLAYTDGLSEAQNPGGDFFGAARLEATLAACRIGPARAVLDGVLAAVREFSAGLPPGDDLTLVVVRRDPPG